MDIAKAEERGTTVALAVFGVLLVLIYFAHQYLSDFVGSELSASILIIAWLFSLAGMDPIRNRYASWEKKRYCAKHGHILAHESAGDGRPYVYCKRCFTVMVSEAPGTHAL